VPISAEAIERALAIAGRSPENYAYFFERLTSPEWIEPLNKRGLFADPPPLEQEDGYIRAPRWPPSEYLARVSNEAARQVLAIALAIETDNERVHQDLTDAAIAMPGPLAAKWAEHELAWITGRERLYFLVPDKLVELAIHLVDSGQAETAIALVFELFRPVGVDRVPISAWDLTTARTRIERWHYEMLLGKALPALLPAAPGETLRVVVELLRETLTLAQQNQEDPAEDYSYIWRTQISDEHPGDSAPEQALVTALRDLTRSARDQRLLSDSDLAELLLAESKAVFRRIAMFAFAGSPDPDAAVLAPLVVDCETLRSDHPSPEYQLLLERAAPLLETGDLEQIIEWIEAGPDLDRYRERMQRGGDAEPSEDEVAEYADRWRARRLRLIQTALPDVQKTEYARLVERVGEQRFTPLYEVGTWVGPTSPLTLDELRELDDEQLVGFLNTWQEPNDRNGPGPSVEGLARALGELVEQDPARFTTLAPQLRDRHAYLSYWTLNGVTAALRKNAQIDWDATLNLAEWLLEQEAQPTGLGADWDSERTIFGWSRKELAAMIEAGVNSENPPNIAYRERLWAILASVAEDADPSPEREQQGDGASMDPAHVALNSTRGWAVRTTVSYAYWVRASSDKEPGDFDAMPEVRHLLDAHLDPEHDPSLAIRSVYGQFLPQLTYLDSQWSRANLSRIFPDQPELSALRDAAWGAYVIYAQPYDNLLNILRPSYAQAIERLGTEGAAFRWTGHPRDPEERLAEHLMTFYWRGALPLDDGDLVERFFASAPVELRAHALEFLGRSARHYPELGKAEAGRLTTLWEARVREVLGAGGETDELKAFGWWLAADGLGLDWRIEQLARLVDARIGPDDAFLVFEALRDAASAHPQTVARLLRQYLDLIDTTWTVSAHTADIEQALRPALESDDARTRNEAIETVQKLGALGHRQFRTMLGRAVEG
jgi:hypothetical protein